MTPAFKQRLIAFVTFFGGAYFFLVYLLPIPEDQTIGGYPFAKIHEQIILGVQVVGIMAIGLGIINIFQVHGVRLLTRSSGWINSVALIFGFIATMFVYTKDLTTSEQNSSEWKEFLSLSLFVPKIVQSQGEETTIKATALTNRLRQIGELFEQDQGPLSLAGVQPIFADPLRHEFQTALTQAEQFSADAVKTPRPRDLEADATKLQAQLRRTGASAQKVVQSYQQQSHWTKLKAFIQNGFFVPLGASMFALLAFYIAGAAYRSFRVRSAEAALMMTAALIVILGQVPQGVYISSELPMIRSWLLDNVSTPAFRAISLGAAVAGLAMAIRMWLSLERSPLETEVTDEHVKS